VAEAPVIPADSRAAVAGLLSFERAVLVATADRIARVPSLPAKMFLCRVAWMSACRARTLRSALPPELVSIASELLADPTTQRLIAAWQAIPSECGFLIALRQIIAPLAANAYGATRLLCDPRIGARLERAGRQYERLTTGRWRWLDRRTKARDVRQELREVTELAAEHEIKPGTHTGRGDLMRTAPPLREPEREHAIRALHCGEAREEVWFVSGAADHRRYLHQLIAFEINTFEAVSRHIAEFASMPWEFHWDMARQIRDELRHLEMWLERLPHAGGSLGEWALAVHEFAICAGHELPGRIGLLERLVEAAALDSLDLNRCLWETRGDPVMVAYLSRVQTDEIGHVRRGNKWLRWLCADDGEIVALVDRAEAANRERLLAAARTLARAGVVTPANFELVRRKFDDLMVLDVNRAVRVQAGFSEAEIAREVERRRHALTAGAACEEALQ
jgi:uncharacterized ferritin-like protein (DUF455 family)